MQEDYFELFGLPQSYEVSLQTLSERFRDLQRVVHPDRYAAADEREKRLSVQYAAEVNDAYQTLKDPVLRAIYLLHCRGVDAQMENNTVMDTAFLMQQMEWREALDEVHKCADPEAALDNLRRDIVEAMQSCQSGFAERWQSNGEQLKAAEDLVRKMQFIDKLIQQLDQFEEALFDD